MSAPLCFQRCFSCLMALALAPPSPRSPKICSGVMPAIIGKRAIAEALPTHQAGAKPITAQRALNAFPDAERIGGAGALDGTATDMAEEAAIELAGVLIEERHAHAAGFIGLEIAEQRDHCRGGAAATIERRGV